MTCSTSSSSTSRRWRPSRPSRKCPMSSPRLSPEPLHVIALDPGERVGWARARVNPDGTWDDMTHGITALKDMALALHKNVTKYDVVIYETWRLRADEARKFA